MSANVEAYAKIVRDIADKRRALFLAGQVEAYARNGVPSETALLELRKSLDAIEARSPERRLTAFNASDLLHMNLPDPDWVVPGLLTEGFCILAGNPKLGKSWLALGLSVAVATGGAVLGHVKVQVGEVLYLSLEDTPRRLKTRLEKVLSATAELPAVREALKRLEMHTEWPKLDVGGLQRIERWLQQHSAARLIVVDTFQKIRGGTPVHSATAYGADYEAVEGLKMLADRYHVAVIIVHHRKKGEGLDDLESISGSYGLTGSADTIWSLRRDRGRSDAVLFVTGRDVDTQELALKWQSDIGSWEVLGEAAEYRLSNERAEIVNAMRDLGNAATPKDLHDLGVGKNYPTLKQLMWNMSKEGQLKSDGGKYSLPDAAPTPDRRAGDKAEPTTDEDD